MKSESIELIGNKYSVKLVGQQQHCERPGGEYDSFVFDYYSWEGTGIIMDLDAKSPRIFAWKTDSGRSMHGSLKNDVLCTSYLASGTSISKLGVLNEAKVIDWFAEQVLRLIKNDEVMLPFLDTNALILIGAMWDYKGQIHLALA